MIILSRPACVISPLLFSAHKDNLYLKHHPVSCHANYIQTQYGSEYSVRLNTWHLLTPTSNAVFPVRYISVVNTCAVLYHLGWRWGDQWVSGTADHRVCSCGSALLQECPTGGGTRWPAPCTSSTPAPPTSVTYAEEPNQQLPPDCWTTFSPPCPLWTKWEQTTAGLTIVVSVYPVMIWGSGCWKVLFHWDSDVLQ